MNRVIREDGLVVRPIESMAMWADYDRFNNGGPCGDGTYGLSPRPDRVQEQRPLTELERTMGDVAIEQAKPQHS